MAAEFQYKAFISYSHRDTRWAQWLLQALETYRLPDNKIRGVGKIFRDRDEAGAASDLKEEIQRALTVSEHLIVVASPNSARSKYVEAEIQAFAAANAARAVPGKILALIVAGEPNVSGTTDNSLECFPAALRGGISKPDGTPFEPLAADARAVGDGRTRALAKLVSGLMDIRYDTLVRRDLIRRRRGRMIAVAASVGALVIAGTVGAVVVAGNLERDRLREQAAAAQRDVRTINAAGNAEQARRLLDGGNFTDAAALARKSLPMDGSLPFVPMAHNVLYGALFGQGAETDLDIGTFGFRVPQTMALGDASYLTVSDTGTATIWSQAAGVTYRRSDISSSNLSGMTPDGSAAYFATSGGDFLHFDAATRHWRNVDRQGQSVPDVFGMRDTSHMFGCNGSRFFTATVENDRFSDYNSVPRPGNACLSLTVTGRDTAIIGTSEGLFELDESGTVLATFEASFAAFWIWSNERIVIAASASGTFVYDRGGGWPIYNIASSYIDSQAVSPGGKYLVETSGTGAPILHDLETFTATAVGCACVFLDFLDDETMLGMGDRVVEQWDTATTTRKENLFTFPTSYASAFPIRGLYLADSKSLLLLRLIGSETILRSTGRPNSTMLVDGRVSSQRISAGAIFAGPDRVVAMDFDDPEASRTTTMYRPTGAGPADNPLFAVEPDIAFPPTSDVASIHALGENVLVVESSRSEDLDYYYDVNLLDAATGAPIGERRISYRPNYGRDQRWSVLAGEDSTEVFDAVRRQFWPLPTRRAGSWSLAGARLAIRDNSQVRIYELGDDAPREVLSIDAGGLAIAICLTADGDRLATAAMPSFDMTLLRYFDLSDGKLLGEASIPETDDTQQKISSAASRAAGAPGLDCEGERLSIDIADNERLIWAFSERSVNFAPPETPESLGLSPTPPAELTADQLRDAVLEWGEDHLWLWDRTHRVLLGDVRIAAGRFSSALYLRDRGQIAAGLEDGGVELWDPRTPSAPLISLAPHTSAVRVLDYNAQKGWLLSADGEGTVNVWPLLTTERLLALTPSS